MYDFVFVVLVYRNTQDLMDFFENLNLESFKVIVVNSFYDDESEMALRIIAEKNDADFISVPNKGYGAGNNCGCEHALKHYNFKYLVISNADINIKSLDISEAEKYGASILAPKIVSLDGKNQNPFWPYKIPKLEFDLKYWMNKNRHTTLILAIYAISKLRRIIFNIMFKITKKRQIWAAHGAFLVLEKTVLETLFPLFNEEMFLFAEEGHLCKKAESKGIKIFYVPEIEVLHKEDGSVGYLSDKVLEMSRRSSMIFYETWFKNI